MLQMAQPFDKKLPAIERRNSRRQPTSSREPNTIEKPILPRREPEEKQNSNRRQPTTFRETTTIEKPVLPRKEQEESQNPTNRRPNVGGVSLVARTSGVKDEDLRDVLEGTLEEMRKKETTIDEMVEKLGMLHSTDQYRLPDEKIVRFVKELRQDIRDWSRNFRGVAQKSGWALILPDQECPFSKVSYQFQRYLDEEEFGPQLLVQSYVWKFLCEKVFGKLLWAGGSCEEAIKGTESLKTLNTFAKKNAKDDLGLKNYHHWRAQTARLMETHRKEHPKCIETSLKNVREKITNQIKGYATSGSIFSNKSGGRDTLQNIVETAVTLDLHLWQQKADFQFVHWSPNPYQRVECTFQCWMKIDRVVVPEEILQKKKAYVHLFCAPSLEKYGSTDGNNYKDGVTICQAVVDILFTEKEVLFLQEHH